MSQTQADMIRIRKMIAEIGNIVDEDIADDSDLLALGLQSMDFVSLVLQLEVEFGLELPENLVRRESFQTPLSIAATIAQCRVP
jgi:acyl carrier protein